MYFKLVKSPLDYSTLVFLEMEYPLLAKFEKTKHWTYLVVIDSYNAIKWR